MGLTIRTADGADSAGMLEIYAQFVTDSPVSFETEVPGEAAFRERIATYSRHAPWLVCAADGRIAGYAYGSRHRRRSAYQWSVDVTVYVHAGFRRQGVGALLYRNLFHCLRLQGFLNAYAGITLPNPASVRLHESLGFKPVGVYEGVGYKLGRWHDVGWWGLRLQEMPERPRPPRPPQAVLADLAWEQPAGV